MNKKLTEEDAIIVAVEALAHLESNLVSKSVCSIDINARYNTELNGYTTGESIEFDTNHENKRIFVNSDSDNTAGKNHFLNVKACVIEKHFSISCELGGRENDLEFEQFSEEVIQPMSYALAEKVDKYTFSKFLECKKIYSSEDLLGAVSGNASKDMAQIRKAANLQQLGKDLFCLLDPTADSTLMGQTWFTGAQNRGNDDILRYGESGTTMGMDFFYSVNWTDHTDDNGCEYHGVVFNKNSLGLAMPLIDPTKGKICCSVSDGGLSLKVTIDKKNGMNTLIIECLAGSFLINSDNMILLGENTPLVKNKEHYIDRVATQQDKRLNKLKKLLEESTEESQKKYAIFLAEKLLPLFEEVYPEKENLSNALMAMKSETKDQTIFDNICLSADYAENIFNKYRKDKEGNTITVSHKNFKQLLKYANAADVACMMVHAYAVCFNFAEERSLGDLQHYSLRLDDKHIKESEEIMSNKVDE